jgi:transposase-like protein
MSPRFDVFALDDRRGPIWLTTAEDIDTAKQFLQQVPATNRSGKYFVVDQQTGNKVEIAL